MLCLENALGNKLPGNQLLFIKNFDNIKPSTQITHFALWVWLFCCFWSQLFFWKLCDIFKNSWGETEYCIIQNNLNSFLYIMMPILKDIATYYSGNIRVWVIFWHNIYLCLTNSLHTWVSQTFAMNENLRCGVLEYALVICFYCGRMLVLTSPTSYNNEVVKRCGTRLYEKVIWRLL